MFVVAHDFMVTSKTDINLFKENIITIIIQQQRTHLSEHIHEWTYVNMSHRVVPHCVMMLVDIDSTLYVTHVMLLLRLFTIYNLWYHCCMHRSNSCSRTPTKPAPGEMNEANRFKYQKTHDKISGIDIYQWDYINSFNGVVAGKNVLPKWKASSSSILM